MATLADGIDFACALFRGESSSSGYGIDRKGESNAIQLCYAVMSFTWMVIWGKFSDRDFSAILTASSFVQCLGFMLLSVKVHGTKSVAGLSSKSLTLFFLFLVARLTSTSLRNGYIPIDSTGDFMYQLIDGLSLVLIVHLLHCIHKTHAHSYQEEHDTLPIWPLVLMCVVGGVFVHGSFNGQLFFDIVWAISANLETFTMVPQLWMMAKQGGKVDSTTAHFVACVVMSNIMAFTWWWYCGPELEKRGPCLLAKVILVAQLFKLLLSADFMYYYALAFIGGGELILPEQEL